jgi:hypothetical protein
MPVIVPVLHKQPIVFHLPAAAEPGPRPANYKTSSSSQPFFALPKLSKLTSNFSCFTCDAYILRNLRKSKSRMSTISHTALSGLINSSPLRSPTSVKLLRFRRLTSGKLVSKVCETLGDDITTCIAGEDLPERVTCDRLTPPKAEAPNTGKDAPYLQIL